MKQEREPGQFGSRGFSFNHETTMLSNNTVLSNLPLNNRHLVSVGDHVPLSLLSRRSVFMDYLFLVSLVFKSQRKTQDPP